MLHALEIELVTDDASSVETRDQLLRLLDKYDLTPWIFTRTVRIERGVIPHSHPILTLNTRHIDSDDRLLATFVHEQIHWWLASLPSSQLHGALEALRQLFPSVPVGFPDGARDEESTYLHLVVNHLEFVSLRIFLGEMFAKDVLEHWALDHYSWIYRMVLEREHEIASIVVAHGLSPIPAA